MSAAWPRCPHPRPLFPESDPKTETWPDGPGAWAAGWSPEGNVVAGRFPKPAERPSPHLTWAPISQGQPGSVHGQLGSPWIANISLGSARVHQGQALERPSSARIRRKSS